MVVLTTRLQQGLDYKARGVREDVGRVEVELGGIHRLKQASFFTVGSE